MRGGKAEAEELDTAPETAANTMEVARTIPDSAVEVKDEVEGPMRRQRQQQRYGRGG